MKTPLVILLAIIIAVVVGTILFLLLKYIAPKLSKSGRGIISCLIAKSDGTVVAAGNSTYGQCDVSDWTDIVAISAGAYTEGLKSDGAVVMAGDNGTDLFRYPKDEIHVRDWTDIMLP